MAEIPAVDSKIYTPERPVNGVEADNQLSNVDLRVMIENEYLLLEYDTVYSIRRLVCKETGKVIMQDAGDLITVQEDKGNFQIEGLVNGEVSASAGNIESAEWAVSAAGESIMLKGVFPKLEAAGGNSPLVWEADLE
jgi:alpha-mannosidase